MSCSSTTERIENYENLRTIASFASCCSKWLKDCGCTVSRPATRKQRGRESSAVFAFNEGNSIRVFKIAREHKCQSPTLSVLIKVSLSITTTILPPLLIRLYLFPRKVTEPHVCVFLNAGSSITMASIPRSESLRDSAVLKNSLMPVPCLANIPFNATMTSSSFNP